MNKFKLHNMVVRGTVPLSMAIGMVLHPRSEGEGYSARPAPDPTGMPEDFAGGLPLRERPGILGPHTLLGNGTSTFAQGTNTYYAWPVPRG
jgi:hypothetical protein